MIHENKDVYGYDGGCWLMSEAAKRHGIYALLLCLLVLTVGEGADFVAFVVLDEGKASNAHALDVFGIWSWVGG